jgi:integrase
VRLHGLPWSPQFMAAYEAALVAPSAEVGRKRIRPGSVAAAVASYFGSSEFSRLKPATQRVRRALLEKFRREHGDKPIAVLPREFVEKMLRQMRPGAAKNWLRALRALLQYCVTEGLCKEDVSAGIKLAPWRSPGFHTWTEEEIAQFEAHHAVGKRPRLALALLLYTGQRRGDVIRMGRQHIRGEMLTITQEKTGTTVAVPVHPELRAIIDATGAANLTFMVTERGRPFSGQPFTQWFLKHCAAAGLPKHCVPHGLRKAAARRLAEAGCTVHEIAAITGHVTLAEIERYTKAVDREKLARTAMARLKTATSSVKIGDV